ncbi:class I SAM-dependent methyltransferase [Candidatus Poribacteria bacterium]
MTDCIVCGSNSFRELYVEEPYHFHECTSCRLLFINPLHFHTSEEKEEVFTDYNWAGTDRDRYDAQRARAMEKAKRRISFLQKNYGINIHRVLEIGAGLGGWCEAFQELGIYYLGVDIDRKAVESGASFGANIIHGDITSPSFQLGTDKPYDMIFASQVIEHILNPRDFMDRIKPLLADNGILYFDFPNPDGIIPKLKQIGLMKGRYEKEYRFLQPPWHFIAYRAPTIEYLLKAHTFELLYLRSWGNSHPVFGQLASFTRMHRLANTVMGTINRGSLSVALAAKRMVF